MERIYLITGAAGHLGNTLTRKLTGQGKRVRALVLPGDKAAEKLDSKAEVYRGDITDINSLEKFFAPEDGCELCVIHAAGIVTIATRHDSKVWNINVGGTKNVVEMCKRYSAAKLVYVSSVHAIPEKKGGEPTTEIYEFDPRKNEGLYAKTKAEATGIVLDAARSGLNASVVHPSGMAGPYDNGRGHLTQLIIDYAAGRLTAGVNGGYDFVDVRDVADGIISCCDKGRSGECYILSGRYVAIPELFEIISGVTGGKRIRNILPWWFARACAPLAEAYYIILRQPPLFTSYSMFTLKSNSHFSHDKASRELDYCTRPFEDTVRDTVKWLYGQKRITKLRLESSL